MTLSLHHVSRLNTWQMRSDLHEVRPRGRYGVYLSPAHFRQPFRSGRIARRLRPNRRSLHALRDAAADQIVRYIQAHAILIV